MEIVVVKQVPLIEHVPPIEAVKLPDKSLGASMKSLCAPLEVARVGQTARIKRTPALARALVLVTIATPGGPQLIDVLLSWAIPIWLSGLQVTRLSPEKQERARIMQERAIAAIEAAFASTEIDQTPEQPRAQVLVQGDAFSLIQEGMLTIIAGMSQLQTGIASLQQTHATILARLAALEGMPRQYSGTGLPPEKVAHLVVLVRALRAKKGVDVDETLERLASQFGVRHFSDIPAAAWPDVLTWLNALLSQEG